MKVLKFPSNGNRLLNWTVLRSKKVIKNIKSKKGIAGIVFLSITLFIILIPTPDLATLKPYSKTTLDHKGKILRAFLNSNQQWCLIQKHTTYPDKLVKAVLHYEDKYFYYHPGINPISILRALKQNWEDKSIKSGASTITMQVARIAKPKKRTYLNKIIEMIQAFKLELLYTKKEILNAYFNFAPYGGNIIGVRAASLRYYLKEPNALTWAEAATLAVLPNSPRLVSPLGNTEVLLKKRNHLLKHLNNKGLISQEELNLSLLENIPENAFRFNFQAPHLSRRLISKNKSQIEIPTSIDFNMQVKSEHIVKRHSRYLRTLGINNACAIVVDTQSAKVKAYVGSSDFRDFYHSGQIDGVMSLRSSGSTLKPLMYGFAFDKGQALPDTLLYDVPVHYGSFSPHNSRREYSGIVSTREALIKSLNIPAVNMLNQLGVHNFYSFLKEAQVTTLFRSPSDYGLPLIIGGAEINLWELAQLFVGLGRLGSFTKITVEPDTKRELTENQLLSPGSSYLILEILKDLKRPGSEYYWKNFSGSKPIAWKTGTSFKQRDAWSVGVNPEWTIAVWVGNFNGEGNANLSGSHCAAPLMFSLFNAFTKKKQWFKAPKNELESVDLCTDTGYLASINCPNTTTGLKSLKAKWIPPCTYHKKIWVTPDGQKRVCSRCWSQGKKELTRLVFSPQVSQYVRENGMSIASIPKHLSTCPVSSSSTAITITYPTENAVLVVPKGLNGETQKVVLEAAHIEQDSFLFWYLNGNYMGRSSKTHRKEVSFTSGNQRLILIDENGRKIERTFQTRVK